MHIVSLLLVFLVQLTGNIASDGPDIFVTKSTILLRAAQHLPNSPAPGNEDSDPGYVEELREEVELEEDTGREEGALGRLTIDLAMAYRFTLHSGIQPGSVDQGFLQPPLNRKEAHRILRC